MRMAVIFSLAVFVCACGEKKYADISSIFGEFPDLDTSYLRTRTGCFNSFYKQVGDTYVVRVTFPSSHCTKDNVELTNVDSGPSAELWVFKEGEATMDNICSDVFVVDAPKPVKKLKLKRGVVDFLETADRSVMDKLAGTVISFVLRNAVFVDDDGREVILRSQLYWEVPNFSQVG